MSRPNRSGRIDALALLLLTLVAGGAASLPLFGGPRRVAPPAVGASTRARALAETVPDRPTMSDEIEHFAARIAARPGEAFSLERLFNAHMLAFRAYGRREHLDRAAELVDRLVEAGPRERRALLAASSLHLARHDFPAALRAATSLSQAGPLEASLYRRFDGSWAVGDWDHARELLEASRDTSSAAYLSRLARVMDAQGRVRRARDVFRRVVEMVRAYAEPASVQAWALVELGHFELHSGSPDQAVRRYLEALDVVPGSPAALEGLASVAHGVDGDLEAAAALYRKALSHGAHLDLQPKLAEVEAALGHPGEAERLRRDFIAKATDDETSRRMYRRALVFVLAESEGTRAEALRLARAELAERQDPGAFDALAWVLYHMGDVEMAWTLEERALSAGAAPPKILYRAGLIADAAGEPRRARELLAEALAGRVELARHEIRAAKAVVAR